MKRILLSMAVIAATVAQAQQFEVVNVEQVKTGAQTAVYHPRFMPDGNLLVSEENYDGLGLVDVKSGSYTLLTDMEGAGYYPVISEDGKTILTRSMDKLNFTQSIYTLDVATKQVTPVVENIGHVNQVTFRNGEVTMAVEGKSLSRVVSGAITPVRKLNNILVTEEDLKIVVYQNGLRTVLDPLAGQLDDWDPQYTWTSLSPDRKKILFGCAGNAYICDLSGANLVKLGDMRAPQWRGNTHVVGMVDADDGYHFTKSDIVIVRADGTQMQQLTSASDEIKMFPAVSQDGNKIAFHTVDGKVYIMTIKEK